MSYVTTIVLILFGLYVANSIYVIYHLFHLPECQGGVGKCLRPDGVIDKKLEVGKTYMYVLFQTYQIQIEENLSFSDQN